MFSFDLRSILDPRCWIRDFPYNAEWDETLNKALDKYGVCSVMPYESNIMRVGPYLVWCANYPYAYGHVIRFDDSLAIHTNSINANGRRIDGLPRRKTARKLHKAVLEYHMEEDYC